MSGSWSSTGTPGVRAALCQLLASEPGLEVCGEAADAAGALGQLAARLPDVVLVTRCCPPPLPGRRC